MAELFPSEAHRKRRRTTRMTAITAVRRENKEEVVVPKKTKTKTNGRYFPRNRLPRLPVVRAVFPFAQHEIRRVINGALDMIGGCSHGVLGM